MKAHGLISAGLALTLTLAASPAVQAADITAGHYTATASLTLTPGETDKINLGRTVEAVTAADLSTDYHWGIVVDKETGEVQITAPKDPADQTGTGRASYGEYTFNVVYTDGEKDTFTILFQAVEAKPENPIDEDEEGDGDTEPGDGEGDEPGDGDDGEPSIGEDEDDPADPTDDESDGKDESDDKDEEKEEGKGDEDEDEADPTDDERTDDNPLPQTSSSSSELSSFGSFLKTLLSFLTRLFT